MQFRIIGRTGFCEFLGISPSNFYQRQAKGSLPCGAKTAKRKNYMRESEKKELGHLPVEYIKGKNTWTGPEAQLMALAEMREAPHEELCALSREIEQARLLSFTEMCTWYEKKFSEPHDQVVAA